MATRITMGQDAAGADVTFDIEELLATRLLVQGNSGSGKSHLLRRLLEESAGLVQQIVVDPEGDFPSLADAFDHVVVDAVAYSANEIEALARRIREHRASVVLDLNGLEVEAQIRACAQFLNALFDAPRDHWYPALVVVDEAQMFAPAAAGEMAEDTRRLTLSAMTNLMCRGRKRGLAGIVATQRLAKLAKNVAAEASNFLMGRTFLDIDMVRAADLLGMDRRQAERIRELERGHFLALGPAISRRPVAVRIGGVQTGGTGRAEGLIPLPRSSPGDMAELLNEGLAKAAREAPVPARETAPSVEDTSTRFDSKVEPMPDLLDQANVEGRIDQIIMTLALDETVAFQSSSAQYQRFLSACRQDRIVGPMPDLSGFRRRHAFATARMDELPGPARERILQLSRQVEDDVLAPFLLVAKAAHAGETEVDEAALARAYGTASTGRVKRLLDHLERLGLVVVREDYGGTRTIMVPGLETLAAG